MRHKAIACLAIALGFAISSLPAAEHHGQVKFGGLPVPGATVTASQRDKIVVALTDVDGNFSFPDLPDGAWTIEVQMQGFASAKQDVNLAADSSIPDSELKILPLEEMHAQVSAAPAPNLTVAPTPAPANGNAKANANAKANGKGKQQTQPTNTQTAFQRTDVNATGQPAPPSNGAANEPAPPASEAFANQSTAELQQRSADGFLVNGTANNGASSPFALNQAFGNNRRGPRSLYNGNLGFTFDNSALDARSFSLTGQDTPKPGYNRMTFMGSFGGPIKIPRLVRRNGPQLTVNYQLSRNRTANTNPYTMPTEAQRNGDFSQTLNAFGKSVQIVDPLNGLPFPNNAIPASRISPQALALLQYYPSPNFTGRYNYQIPIVGNTHQDQLQARVNKQIGRKNGLSGEFAFQSNRTNNPNAFSFLDATDILGIRGQVNWRHQFTPRFFGTFGYEYSRLSTHVMPYFENRTNVSGDAGITGNNQQSVNWGPPALNFSSGIQGLSDGIPSFNRNQTGKLSYNGLWNHGRQEVQFGADYTRQEFNYNTQQDPRGTFGFTGAATGYDFADFLLGIPDTSSIAFGNADKYFRANQYDAFVTDNWRVSPGLTINAGGRWEYWSPISELFGRLVNLDVAPGYSAVMPVVGYQPVGSLTGQAYPASLMQSDKHAFQPRIGLSWRPISGSSIIVRAGYGVYYNTSPYQAIAQQMAQQSPLSKSLRVQNSAENPLTLANGFNASPNTTTNTFAVDPNFRVGYAQNWQLSIQRDLPAGLQMNAIYLGIKGTRGMQEFLPNTFPNGAANPCLSCPSGFTYLTSNGNSTRESGSFQLRRRLRNGFTAQAQYTFSKSIDDSALGGQGQASYVVAQNWLDLSAERALSNFDQRHLLNLQAQYTSGVGLGGGTLTGGWKGALLKEWTVLSNITVGSGKPLTPSYPAAAVAGTGFTGSVRPNYTGAPLYSTQPGLFLNPAAFTAPTQGEWGNAGRDSITGPSQFSLNASVQRTFRVNDRFSLDLRVDANNALNHVVFTSWITQVGNDQFGLPTAPNAMRSVQTTLRMRF